MANFDDLQGAVAQFGANNKVIFDDMSRSLTVTTARTVQTGLKGLFSVPVDRKKIELL